MKLGWVLGLGQNVHQQMGEDFHDIKSLPLKMPTRNVEMLAAFQVSLAQSIVM